MPPPFDGDSASSSAADVEVLGSVGGAVASALGFSNSAESAGFTSAEDSFGAFGASALGANSASQAAWPSFFFFVQWLQLHIRDGQTAEFVPQRSDALDGNEIGSIEDLIFSVPGFFETAVEPDAHERMAVDTTPNREFS